MPTKKKTAIGTKKKRAAVTKKRGPIPVAEAGDLPKGTLVVSLDFAKKHWGKAALSAGALGLAGAGGAIVNQALKNAKTRRLKSYADKSTAYSNTPEAKDITSTRHYNEFVEDARNGGSGANYTPNTEWNAEHQE